MFIFSTAGTVHGIEEPRLCRHVRHLRSDISHVNQNTFTRNVAYSNANFRCSAIGMRIVVGFFGRLELFVSDSTFRVTYMFSIQIVPLPA